MELAYTDFPCAYCGDTYNGYIKEDGMPLFSLFCSSDCEEIYWNKPLEVKRDEKINLILNDTI